MLMLLLPKSLSFKPQNKITQTQPYISHVTLLVTILRYFSFCFLLDFRVFRYKVLHETSPDCAVLVSRVFVILLSLELNF